MKKRREVRKVKQWGCPKCLMLSSLIAVALATIGFLETDIWLASTQWILIAILLAVWGLWFKLEK